MKKYHLFLLTLVSLIILFSCTASTVIIDGTFEGVVENQKIVFHLKRQAHDNSVFGRLKSDFALPSYTIPSGTFFWGTLLDSENFIILRVYIGKMWNLRVLENGGKLESTTSPKVFFKRK